MTTEFLEEKEVRLSTSSVIKILWPLVRPFIWMLLLSMVLSLCITFFELMIPLFIQRGLDGFILTSSLAGKASILGLVFHDFTEFSFFFAGMIVLQLCLGMFQSVFMEYTGQKIILSLRSALFSQMTRLPISYFDKTASGRLVSRVAGDLENMSEMFTSVLVFMARDLGLMAGIVVMAVRLNPVLSMYFLWLIPCIFIGTMIFGRITRKIFRTIRQKLGEINHHFSEVITGVLVIQTTASQQIFMQRFAALSLAHFKAAVNQIRVFSFFMPFLSCLGTIAMAVLLYHGGSLVLKQELSIGALVAFLAYNRLFFRPLWEMSERFNVLQNALASAERVAAVMQEEAVQELALPEISAGKSSTSFSTSSSFSIGSVEFSKVGFAYEEGLPVLQDISFSLEKGQSLGIAGHTGSGKTSIINLLTGFYPLNAGKILINGMDYLSFDVQTIRSKMALVMQDPVLFSGTVRENIAPWGKAFSDEFLLESLEKAGCSFLMERFDGLDTRLMENGYPLSAGEKQLLSIARAFAMEPDLIIFDEATSYMDSNSELAIHKALERLMRNRIAIIVAHRLSTIRECTEIMLIRQGSIREKGSHQNLAALRGEYFHLLKKESV